MIDPMMNAIPARKEQPADDQRRARKVQSELVNEIAFGVSRRTRSTARASAPGWPRQLAAGALDRSGPG